MQIHVTYNKKLVIQALRFHFITRPEIRVLIILVNIFAIFSAALFYFKKVSPLAFLISSVLWVVLMVSFWFIMPLTVYRNASTFTDAFDMYFSDTGIRLENNRGYTEWNWNKFSSFFETPHFIHLYFDSRSFFLVPKAAAEKEGNLSQIRELLKRHIKKK
jgi:hypothetical protein